MPESHYRATSECADHAAGASGFVPDPQTVQNSPALLDPIAEQRAGLDDRFGSSIRTCMTSYVNALTLLQITPRLATVHAEC